VLPERRAAQQLMSVAVEFAAEFNPTEPGWSIAAQMCLAEDWSRDVLVAAMVNGQSYDAAVPAMGSLPRDPAMNRDAVIAVALWLGGNTEQASVVAGMARENKLAGLIELLIITGVDPAEWGRRLVDSLTERRPDPATIGPALKPR
jgi:hypothetical protein